MIGSLLDKYADGFPMVQFQKKIDGTMYVVEAIPDSKRKSLAVVSAYMQKNSGSGIQVLNMAQSAPQLTSETPVGASSSPTDTSITDSAANVNAITSQQPDNASPAYGTAENHIDNRTPDYVGSRSVKAFQFDHPKNPSAMIWIIRFKARIDST
jgi:hypothetical protein